jgi:uncharacterized protein YukE
MGLFGDIEHAAEDVVHVGEDVVEDVGSMLSALHGFLTDAGLGNVVQELEQLAEQANQLKQQLASAEAGTKWSGAAADGFRQRAQQRQQQLTELVGALDSAHSAVAAAYAVAGIF